MVGGGEGGLEGVFEGGEGEIEGWVMEGFGLDRGVRVY